MKLPFEARMDILQLAEISGQFPLDVDLTEFLPALERILLRMDHIKMGSPQTGIPITPFPVTILKYINLPNVYEIERRFPPGVCSLYSSTHPFYSASSGAAHKRVEQELHKYNSRREWRVFTFSGFKDACYGGDSIRASILGGD
jgi:hypothetical protein